MILYDKDGNALEIDDQVRAAFLMDSVHGMIHKGKLFDAVAETQSLANNGTLDLLLRPAAVSHLRFAGFCGGNAHIQVYRNPTYTIPSPTNAITPAQHNDLSSKASGMLVNQDPTVTDVGTQWNGRLPIFGGQVGQAHGASSDFNFEFILIPANEYLIRLTNISGGAQDSHILAVWYEPTL